MNERARWDELVDSLATGDPISGDERRFVDDFGDEAIEDERAFYRSLAMQGGAGELESLDREHAQATLAEFRRARPPKRSLLGAGVGVGALLVAVAAAVFLWVRLPETTIVEVMEPSARVASGTLMLDDVELAPGDALPVDRWVVAHTPACVRAGQGRACVGAAARLRLHDDRLELGEGTLEFVGTGIVQTPMGEIVAEDAKLEVRLQGDTGQVVARAGSVVVRDAEGHEGLLAEGETWVLGEQESLAVPDAVEITDPEVDETSDEISLPSELPTRGIRAAPTSSQASPGELLSSARRYVAQGKTGKALSAYASLRRQHPGSPEAHTANVSTGELELRRGRAKSALRAFSRYLSGGAGPLAEEAHWGKIRALHRLGRLPERDRAVKTLRSAHPRSVYLTRASEL